MKKANTLLLIGQFSLILGILGFILNFSFFHTNTIIAIFTGLFFGLSLVFNLAFLVSFKKYKKTD